MGYSIDIEAIAKELDFDVEDIEMLLEAFLDSSQESLQEMSEAIESKDYETIFSSAHAIKGIASNLRLLDISETAKNIESSAREGLDIDYKADCEKLKTLIGSIEE